MNRIVATIIGLGLVAVAAILIGRAFLKPASERAQAKGKVLTGQYDARLDFCDIIEDAELPEGLEPPGVGSTVRFVQVIVLFPQVNVIKGDPQDYVLDKVNGATSPILPPVHSEMSVEEEGVILTLTYETDVNFEYARLVRDEDVVLKRVGLQE